MKRPEGFDGRRTASPPSHPARRTPPPVERAAPDQQGRDGGRDQLARDREVKPARSGGADIASLPSPLATGPESHPVTPRTLRQAARARRRVERDEVRRFTRRSRSRRLVVAATAGLLVTLIGLIVTAVYSPLLALRSITVVGTSRIDSAEIVAALDDQLGTPLALIDFGRISTEMSAFPLIRSYATEIAPPGTLVIHISERQPIASVSRGTGFDLVDPAGVVVQQSAVRIAGVPLVDVGGAPVDGPAFRAVVEVLLALPPDLASRVDQASSTSQDDVSLVLAGVGQRVAWGGRDRADRKARLLAALIAVTDPAAPGVFDVSAPDNGVFRRG